jgi:hypothetical protein
MSFCARATQASSRGSSAKALVDQVEIDAGIHEPRIMPTEMIACRRSPDASALLWARLCSALKFHQPAADTGSANCLFSEHSMTEGRENASTARF